MSKPVQRTGHRVTTMRPLIPPACLLEELPLPKKIEQHVEKSRQTIADIIHGRDDRLLLIVGPCSIHDVKAAKEYATRLAGLAKKVKDNVFIVMRCYFEKPRTTVGWKGLINDPQLDGSFQINKGLRIARKLLLEINEIGLPVACELLDTISPQFIADLMSWGCIGARTTESQLHRELVSGLSMPVGFKNGTTGSFKVAVDGCISAANPHNFLGVTSQGLAAIVKTTGNRDCHLVLRGGTKPNYHASDIKEAVTLMNKAKFRPAVVVDCSHGNSLKDHRNQPKVVKSLCDQLSAGQFAIIGAMMESNLVAGNQKLTSNLTYGQSITDKCICWEKTVEMSHLFSKAIDARRKHKKPRARL